MRSSWQYLKKQGISMPQMFALLYVHYHGEANISDIARELGVSPASASQLLDRLVRQGVIVRQAAPHDRRRKRIVLTQEGREIVRGHVRAHQAWIEALANRLNPEEQQLVIRALSLLAHHAEDIVETL